MSREQDFLANLPLIERVIAAVCARRGLKGAEAQDFASAVKSRLIENDYEILARFEGRASLQTYLSVVVTRLYVDRQVRCFGRWRPSVEARRLGPVGIRLERLLYRDRLTFDEAFSVLNQDFRVSRESAWEMSVRLPDRNRRETFVAGDMSSASDSPASGLEQRERQALAASTFAAIRRALATLSGRDRLILRLLFETGLTIAEIARSLGLDQKALYRRRDEILKRVREDVEAEGIDSAAARGLLETLDWDTDADDPAGFRAENSVGIGGPCPSEASEGRK